MFKDSETGYRTSSANLLDRTAQGLAWFSIGLGVAELVAPGAIGRALGLQNREGLLRAYGVREIAAGIGAMQPNPAPAIWSRVGGDLVDLATLAMAVRSENEKRGTAKAAIGAVAAITVLDLVVAAALTGQQARPAEVRDYSDRSGFPMGIEAARGAAARARAPQQMPSTVEGAESRLL
jgi:hypothetical protein